MSIEKKFNNYIIRSGEKLIKNKDVFKIEGKWVRANEVVIDNLTGEKHNIKRNDLVPCYSAEGGRVMSSKVVQIDHDMFCASALNSPKLKNKLNKHLSGENLYVTGATKISVPVNKNRNKSIYSFSQKAITPVLQTNIPFSSILDRFTYGFEIETSAGEVSDNAIHEYGFTTIYDGSIQGHELVSKPLNSNEVHHVGALVKQLPYCCSINRHCSLHIHIGNIPRTETNLLRIYDIYTKLQDELWLLVPPYKKEIEYLKNIDKDYVKTLIKFRELNVRNIMNFFGLSSYNFTQVSNMEQLLGENRKWVLDGRYHFINFLNYICKRNGAGTIEVRLLQSTFNWKLIQTWLLINVLIINHAITNNIIGSKVKIDILDIINSSELEDHLKPILISNMNIIKDIYFDHTINKVRMQNMLEEIDKVMEKQLRPYEK